MLTIVGLMAGIYQDLLRPLRELGREDSTITAPAGPALAATEPELRLLSYRAGAGGYYLPNVDWDVEALPRNQVEDAVDCRDWDGALKDIGAQPASLEARLGLIAPNGQNIAIVDVTVLVVEIRPYPDDYSFLVCERASGGPALGAVITADLDNAGTEGAINLVFTDDDFNESARPIPPASFENGDQNYETLIFEPYGNQLAEYHFTLSFKTLVNGKERDFNFGTVEDPLVYAAYPTKYSRQAYWDYDIREWVESEVPMG